jgi:coronin-7
MDTDNNGTNQDPNYIENDSQTKGDEFRGVPFKEVVDNVLASPSKDSLVPHEDETKGVMGLLSENASERDDQPNSGSSEDLPPSSQSHGKPKTPSTAERRKLYEKRISSMAGEQDSTQLADTLKFDDADDKVEDFERSSVQRSSIAERRRIYENRSVSAQEAGVAERKSPTVSPTPLRRQDSYKSSKAAGPDMVKEDTESKRPHSVQRQHSQDQPAAGKTPPQDKKLEPVTTPTPKRTSTVFGK